jgi:hypothetical protein
MVTLLFKWLSILTVAFAGSELSTPSATAALDLHPFYVSVTEINHNATDKNLEISCKIFTDDFEATLTKNFNTRVDLFNPRDKQQVDRFISDYVGKHLVIKLDGKPVHLEFVGFERESEAVWSYFQVKTPAPKKVEITNTLLYDSFNEQINLMHITVNGSRKSTKLNYPNGQATFQF